MNKLSSDRIGIVVKSTDSPAKVISIVRKYNPVSMAEIKQSIGTDEFIFSCDDTNDSGIRKVRRCFDELTKIGAEVEIYEDGELSSRELISNLIDTYHEIELETQAIIDEEVAAECEDND
jgi:hypothetical protein